MPYVIFEPTIPASEQAKTVHALDRSATMTVINININIYTVTVMTVRPGFVRPAYLFHISQCLNGSTNS
jgi:hypothetical protein